MVGCWNVGVPGLRSHQQNDTFYFRKPKHSKSSEPWEPNAEGKLRIIWTKTLSARVRCKSLLWILTSEDRRNAPQALTLICECRVITAECANKDAPIGKWDSSICHVHRTVNDRVSLHVNPRSINELKSGEKVVTYSPELEPWTDDHEQRLSPVSPVSFSDLAYDRYLATLMLADVIVTFLWLICSRQSGIFASFNVVFQPDLMAQSDADSPPKPHDNSWISGKNTSAKVTTNYDTTFSGWGVPFRRFHPPLLPTQCRGAKG